MASTLYTGLLIATLIQGTLIIGALLTSKRGHKTANYLLSGIIALFSYYALVKILCSSELISDYPNFTQSYRPLPFLIWVAFYFYTRAMTTSGFHFQVKDSVHLLPFSLYTFYLLPYFLSDKAIKLQTISAPIPLHYYLAVILQTGLLFFYLKLSFDVLKAYEQNLKTSFSNLEKIKLAWLKHLLLAFGVIWGAAFVKAFFLAPSPADFVIPPILLCLVIYVIGFYALKQPTIFFDSFQEMDRQKPLPSHSEPASVEIPASKQATKYKYSGLTPEDISSYKERLTEYLESEKPYLDNELNLKNIAGHLEIAPHQLSQIINTGSNRNFYDLINSYRIEETRRLLADPSKQNLTIIDIAYEVGFNSKSAFNSAFKKYTNMTPSQYKESQMNV